MKGTPQPAVPLTTKQPDLGTLGVLIGDHRNEGRMTRAGILVAVALHMIAFAITWPSIAGPPPEAPEPQVLRVVRLYQFTPPEHRPQELPQVPRRRSVPIPDSTPNDPEPIRDDDELQIPTDYNPDEVDFWVIPPEPPPETPSVVRANHDIEPPVRTHFVQPVYPQAALHARFGGTVVVELLIDEAGRVADVKVIAGKPLGLTEAAVEAASQWEFEPSTLNGRPVSVIYQLTVTFTPI